MDIWIDMDSTLMNFSNGDLDKALESMADPDYYLKVYPFNDAMCDIGKLNRTGLTVNIVSGIPDHTNQKKYLPPMSVEEYNSYYNAVADNKRSILDRFFGPTFFDNIVFTKASQSKADYVNRHFYNSKGLQNTALIDDYIVYVHDWSKLGGKGIWLGDGKTFKEALYEATGR